MSQNFFVKFVQKCEKKNVMNRYRLKPILQLRTYFFKIFFYISHFSTEYLKKKCLTIVGPQIFGGFWTTYWANIH